MALRAPQSNGTTELSPDVKRQRLTSDPGEALAEAIAFAKQSRPFGLKPLSSQHFQQLAHHVTLQAFAAGELVFDHGDTSVFGGHTAFVYEPGTTFGEVGVLECAPRRAAARATSACDLLCLPRAALDDDAFPPGVARDLYAYLGRRVTSLLLGDDLYNELDVLIVQDGGCAPGYNTCVSPTTSTTLPPA